MAQLLAPTPVPDATPEQRSPHRAPSRRPAVAAGELVLGAVLAASGAGLGIRYAQKTGLSATTLAGLALSLLGLLLLAVGLRTAWRGLRRRYRLLLLPLVVALLLPASSVGLAVAVTQVPPTTLGSGTPADHGLPYRDVTFGTSDGVQLSGWLVPSRNGAAVVVLHGAGSTRSSTLRHVAVLAELGYGVLAYDARGHGRSGGSGMDLGWWGDLDLASAVTFAAAQPAVDADRVGVLGLSMGGEQAIGAAGGRAGIAAVVAEGATGRTAQDKDSWLPGGVAGTVQRGLDRLTFGLVEVLTDRKSGV
jgi:hypothetical protein